jgi:hypothetical protein
MDARGGLRQHTQGQTGSEVIEISMSVMMLEVGG